MRKSKRLVIIITLIILVFLYIFFFCKPVKADDETGTPDSSHTAPNDIHLTIETKEFDIEDVPENRIVSLDVSTENCPPYVVLFMYFKKDSRLKYLNSHEFETNRNVNSIGGMTVELETEEYKDYIGVFIPAAEAAGHIEYNGVIGKINVVLPEDVNPGDFYNVEFVKYREEDGEPYEMEIALENDFDYMYGQNSFSVLNSGGIKIKGNANEVIPDNENDDKNEESNKDESQEDKIGDDSQKGIKSEDDLSINTDNKDDSNPAKSDEVEQDKSIANTQLGKYGNSPILIILIFCVIAFSIHTYRKIKKYEQ